MKDKLEVRHDRGIYRITWWIAEDGDYGADLEPTSKPEPTERDEWEWWAANKAAAEATPKPQTDRNGFFWESNAAATTALRQIKAALKVERPLPEWAKQALAAGWPMPKGWKP